MAVVMVTVTSEPLIMGTMIWRNFWRSLAPSRLAASVISDGHALDGGREHDHGEAGLEPDEDDDQQEGVEWAASGNQGTGSRPKPVQIALRRPICGRWPGRQA